jgi:hypothetical protein
MRLLHSMMDIVRHSQNQKDREFEIAWKASELPFQYQTAMKVNVSRHLLH